MKQKVTKADLIVLSLSVPSTSGLRDETIQAVDHNLLHHLLSVPSTSGLRDETFEQTFWPAIWMAFSTLNLGSTR